MHALKGHWAEPFYAAVDRLDIAVVDSYLSDDVSFQFGGPAEVGRAAAARGLAFVTGTVRGIEHHVSSVWDPDERTTILEADVTYSRWVGDRVTCPCATIIGHDGATITSLHIHMNAEPLVRGQVAHLAFSGTVEVNPEGEHPVTRADLWHALVQKARHADRFVPQISACTVVEEGDGWFERDAVIEGEPTRERITLDPEHEVLFTRVTGREMGTIRNTIDEDADGALRLRFSFDLTLPGVPEGSPLHQQIEQHISAGYTAAFENVLDNLRAAAVGR